MPQPVAEIVVIGERVAALRPQRSIGSDDLLAYGAGTVGELLDEVAAENGEGSAAVTILVNGQRVPGLGDIDSYPAEAIERVDILPRESGARFGAPAGRRVYNIVLKPQTRLATARGRARAATEGGSAGATVDLGATQIRRPQRLNVALQLRRDSALLESERQVEQAEGAPANLGASRTLRPSTSGAELTLSGADQLLPWLDGLVTLKLSKGSSRSALGLSEAGTTIDRLSRSRTIDLTAQLNAERGSWAFTVDGGSRASRRQTSTSRDTRSQRTSAIARSSFVELLAHGPLTRLPAGSLHLTLGASVRRDRFDSRSSDGVGNDFGRTSREARAGFEIPILSRGGPLPALGDLSLRAELSRGSTGRDGGLRGRTLSARWSPTEWLQLSAVHSRSRSAPNIDLLGEPVLETGGVRYFDPLRRETVDVVTLTGGRFDLPTQSFATQRLTADFRPVKSVDLLLTTEYATVENSNVVGVLPLASDLVLQLFPDRFERNAGGQLSTVDLRPVIFPRQREAQLRAGLNLNVPLGKGGGRPRLQVAGSYRLLIKSRLDLGDGFGTANLLERQSIALGGAMRPRHQFDFTLGYSERGLGVRLTGERRAQSFLGSGQPDGVLTFEPLTTFSLRGFVEGRRIAADSVLLRDARIGLNVNNLANRRERVRDGQGNTPLAYQAALRDPLGRMVELEFRKTF